MLLSLTVFMNIVSELMPITSDAVPLIGNMMQSKYDYTKSFVYRDILQLHPGHGGQQCCPDGPCSQLPPPQP